MSVPSGPTEQIQEFGETGSLESVKKQSYNRELKLSNQTLSLKMAKALARALEEDQVFVKVMLGDCLLGDDGCISICTALKQNTTVEYLDLKGNNIRADGTISLAQMIKINATIKHLILEWNCMGIWENGIKSLGDALSLNQGLKELDLRNNKIGPDGASALALGLKANTYLQRLDLRWNNIGILGARVILDMLKWNQTLLYLDIQGNEVPDDLAHAIEMALERNRHLHSSDMENTKRAHYLSNTLQQISVEHEETIQGLKARLLSAETEAKALGSKLTMAADEIEASHLGNKVAQQKLLEETTKRERAEQKLLEYESLMAQERREFSDKCKEFMNDLIKEREERRQMEFMFKQRMAQEAEKALVHDSNLKQVELNLERSTRENKELEKEISRLKKDRLEAEENIAKIQSQHKSDLASAETEWKNKHSTLVEQLKATIEQVERSKGAYLDMENSLKSLESRIRQEEQLKRNEIIGRLQIITQQRDACQQNLNASSQQYKSIISDLESKLKQSKQIEVELAQISTDRKSQEEEIAKLKSINGHVQKRNEDLSAALSKLQLENEQLKEDLNYQKEKLDRRREDEISRARELEKAISGYVKSIERSK